MDVAVVVAAANGLLMNLELLRGPRSEAGVAVGRAVEKRILAVVGREEERRFGRLRAQTRLVPKMMKGLGKRTGRSVWMCDGNRCKKIT